MFVSWVGQGDVLVGKVRLMSTDGTFPSPPRPLSSRTGSGRDGRIRVAIVFGGRSSEHSISCVTAGGVLGAIDRDRFDVVPIGITRDGRWVRMPDDPEALKLGGQELPEVTDADSYVSFSLEAHSSTVIEVADRKGGGLQSLGDIDVVLPLLHGPFGEDGTIQGLFELAEMRYVGCGVLASAMMMDKHWMKVAFEAAGLPVGPYRVITDKAWRIDAQAALESLQGLKFPMFVKPARAGSSFGITKVDAPEGLREAIEAAREHDPKVVVEQGIVGREIECGVLSGHGLEPSRASMPGEIVVADHDFYDFEAKYLSESDVTLSCPAKLPEDVTARLRELAVHAFDAVECEGLARCDFFFTPDGELIINEINTLPGFTPFSMFPSMWAATGLEYSDLITDLIELALERRAGLR
ncbi:D-alanine--D-alanine ligase [Dermatophilus congolensis]|uniref:D-alanine--D-alanine ligase n=2 Tax=Dermatophilus congolensis TaxID=1863 RepID=A0A239VFT9_9MICO|nr:D-alanine--D-alanine ligase [Dermatophilus congolensis]